MYEEEGEEEEEEKEGGEGEGEGEEAEEKEEETEEEGEGEDKGATIAPLVQLLLWLFFLIAYPISKVLDWMLGKGHAALLRRVELKTFVDFHGNKAGK
ncbi:hypothetical protein FXO38_35046 [Capsicum annuum]|nr:hypothetical protein FXO38_35046 [Capsicum annuum]